MHVYWEVKRTRKKVMCDLKSIHDRYFWQLLLEHCLEKNIFGLWTLINVLVNWLSSLTLQESQIMKEENVLPWWWLLNLLVLIALGILAISIQESKPSENKSQENKQYCWHCVKARLTGGSCPVWLAQGKSTTGVIGDSDNSYMQTALTTRLMASSKGPVWVTCIMWTIFSANQ